jgi:hypothetical protein
VVVEYGQSVHAQLEAAPGKPGPAGDATDVIRSMALSSAELWHDVLQRLAELQESQVILAQAIADLGAMVQESLTTPRAGELAGATDALPAGPAPDVATAPEPSLDLTTPSLDADVAPWSPPDPVLEAPERGAEPAVADLEPSSVDLSPVEPRTEDPRTEDLALADVTGSVGADLPAAESVERSAAPQPETLSETQPHVPGRRRFLFRRRPEATAAATVEALVTETDAAEEAAEPAVEPVPAVVSISDEDYPPLPPPPVDETWEPVAEPAPLRPPQPLWLTVLPPPPAAAEGTDAVEPVPDPVSSAEVEATDPGSETRTPPISFAPAPLLAQGLSDAPAEEPAAVDEAEEPIGPSASPPAPPYSMMAPPPPPPPPPPAASPVIAPPAPPATPGPYSVIAPPPPSAPYAVMEPPAPPERPSSPAPPPAIAYVPATAEPAESTAVASEVEAPAPAFPGGSGALDVPSAEVTFPPLPPPPAGADEGPAEPAAAPVEAAEEPALVAVGAGPSHSSASLATEILASTPTGGSAEAGQDRPDVLMVSEDLTLVSKSRKRRIQFRLR